MKTRTKTNAPTRNTLQPINTKNDVVVLYSSLNDDSSSDGRIVKKGDSGRTIFIDTDIVTNLAKVGLSREMVANYLGLRSDKFFVLCEEYPELDEAYMMGLGMGAAKAALALDNLIDNGKEIATIFRCKVGGMIEADKKRDTNTNNTPKVNIFLPSNGRDVVGNEPLENVDYDIEEGE